MLCDDAHFQDCGLLECAVNEDAVASREGLFQLIRLFSAARTAESYSASGSASGARAAFIWRRAWELAVDSPVEMQTWFWGSCFFMP
jgi:hypothetical protein